CLYVGDGQQHYEPLLDAPAHAEPYLPAPDLKDAVNMALYLRRPLLVEGEPGTGKTRLAFAVAYELGYPLYEIYIRSTSRAHDLLLVLDRLRFEVDEVRGMVYDALGDQTREERRHFLPLVIITSNREKELPAPFLRRCLYYYIPFPQKEELENILKKHFIKGV